MQGVWLVLVLAQLSAASHGARALDVISEQLSRAKAEPQSCQQAARAAVVAGRGYLSLPVEHEAFVTKDGQHWTGDAARHAVEDLTATGEQLYARCGGKALDTTATEELAVFGLQPTAAMLEAEAASELSIELPEALFPGAEVPLRAVLTSGTGRRVATADELAWSCVGGVIEGDAVQLPEDAESLLATPPSLTVVLKRKPTVQAHRELLLTFERRQWLNVRGTEGGRGAPGAPFATKGGTGAAAPTAQVSLSWVSTPWGKLALVRVVSGKQRTARLVDLKGEPLIIDARGGDGGAGGNGADGTDGARASSDLRSGGSAVGGAGGLGGFGANGGDGGAGASVTVRYDRRHPELMSAVRILNAGGKGGTPGLAGRGGRGGLGGFGNPVRKTFCGKTVRGVSSNGDDGPDGFAGQLAGRSGKDGPEPKWIASEPERLAPAGRAETAQRTPAPTLPGLR